MFPTVKLQKIRKSLKLIDVIKVKPFFDVLRIKAVGVWKVRYRQVRSSWRVACKVDWELWRLVELTTVEYRNLTVNSFPEYAMICYPLQKQAFRGHQNRDRQTIYFEKEHG